MKCKHKLKIYHCDKGFYVECIYCPWKSRYYKTDKKPMELKIKSIEERRDED